MLKLLRNKKVSKKIFYGLAIIIIPAFVVWGSASVMKGDKGPNTAGRIFGERVSADEFRDAYRNWRIQLRFQYGDKAAEAAAFMNPLQATWERLIVMREIKNRNIRVSDQEVVRHITNLPFLQRDGRFDKQAYNLYLKYSLGVGAREFEETLRQTLLIYKFSNIITEDVSVADEEVRDAYEKENVTTQVRYASFRFDAFRDDVAVTEEDVASYYEASRETLRVPPQINTSYIGLEFDDKELGLTQEEMAAKIQQALAAARQMGLKAAAQDIGLEVKETGFFGFEDPIPDFGWLPQLSRVLFDMPVLSFSKIVQTSRGLYIFQVTEKKDAYVPDLKEAAPRIRTLLTESKSKEMARAKAETFLDLVRAQKKTFEEAARQADVEVKESEPFSREAYISELGMAPALKETAFALEEGDIAEDVIELEQEYLVVQSMKTPFLDEEAFEDEKEAFGLKVLKDRRTEAFNTYFLSLRERAQIENYVDPSALR